MLPNRIFIELSKACCVPPFYKIFIIFSLKLRMVLAPTTSSDNVFHWSIALPGWLSFSYLLVFHINNFFSFDTLILLDHIAFFSPLQ